MAATVNIPLTVLAVGEHDFGPATLADTDTAATLSIDRTVSKGNVQGFNGQPPATTATIDVQQSSDGGATWVTCGSEEIVGGIYTDAHHGTQINTSTVGIAFTAGTGRQARAVVTVAGASVAVAGSLTIS